jgi:hypothetical protein
LLGRTFVAERGRLGLPILGNVALLDRFLLFLCVALLGAAMKLAATI